MAKFEDTFIDKLKTSIPLSQVIASFGHSLKSDGGGRFKCLSPFRDEKTASFKINDVTNSWCDFGDGNRGGDAIGFIQESNSCGFVEAIETLAQIGSIPLEYAPDNQPRASQVKSKANAQDLIRVNDWVANIFAKQFAQDPSTQDYAKNTRGLTQESIERFSIGHAPDGYGFLRDQVDKNYHSALITADLLTRSERNTSSIYDKFRDRLMFPIKDLQGKTVGFGGRTLSDNPNQPKYLNSAETAAFKKGRTLYGLYETLQADRKPASITVVEGYLDVIKMHQSNFQNTTSTNGTAVTLEQVALAFRFTDHLTFAFDGDAAGLKAAYKAMDNSLPHVVDGKSVDFVFFPKGHDPDSILTLENGQKEMKKLIGSALSLSDFAYARITQNLDIRAERNLSQMAKNAVDVISLMPNGIYRDSVVSKISQKLSLEPARILKAVDENVQKKIPTPTDSIQKVANNDNSIKPRQSSRP